MEKLVKLLNEYHFSWTEYIWYFLDEEENRIYFRTKVVDKWLIDEQRISDERIISKKFWFIKRLVKNNKVDLKKANNIDNWPLFDYYSDEDALIMALSINNEPLKFLESILK